MSQESSTTVLEEKSHAQQVLEDFKPLLNELKTGFWVIISFFAVGAVVGMAFYKQILSFVMGLFEFNDINVVLTSPYQFIDLSINSGFFIGLIFSFPAFLFYFLRFVKPALKREEFSHLAKMLPFSFVLFVAGFCFGVWVLQFVVDMFSNVSVGLDVGSIWDLSGFINQVIITGMSMALLFQMPVVITSLLKLNILSYHQISSKRKETYAGLFLFAAILPPTDLVSLAVLALVPLFLFEFTLLLNRYQK